MSDSTDWSYVVRDENKARLLLVDDEALNREMLSRRLERGGFFVDVASNGRDAIQTIRERAFDLVLLDQMMPGMSGAEVLQSLCIRVCCLTWRTT